MGLLLVNLGHAHFDLLVFFYMSLLTYSDLFNFPMCKLGIGSDMAVAWYVVQLGSFSPKQYQLFPQLVHTFEGCLTVSGVHF